MRHLIKMHQKKEKINDSKQRLSSTSFDNLHVDERHGTNYTPFRWEFVVEMKII